MTKREAFVQLEAMIKGVESFAREHGLAFETRAVPEGEPDDWCSSHGSWDSSSMDC
jgi:hypothetical protein